jgi:flavin reductase (DIM6/NTAB) family NADH-FMN oxidoreductase RutF
MTTFLPAGMVSTVDFRDAMSQFATCVTVVTTAGPVGCTATAVFSVSADPPSLGVSLRTGSRTLAAIVDAGTFAVNVLSVPQQALTTRFAAGRHDHRFDGVPVHWRHGVPAFAEAATSVVCRVHRSLPLLDHTLLVGLVLDARVTNDARPIVFYQRKHHELGGQS